MRQNNSIFFFLKPGEYLSEICCFWGDTKENNEQENNNHCLDIVYLLIC